MQIVFGSHTFEAAGQPRENGNMLILAFDPSASTFDQIKAILHSATNTRSIEFVDGEDGVPEVVVVILAGTRENFYDELKRYWL